MRIFSLLLIFALQISTVQADETEYSPESMSDQIDQRIARGRVVDEDGDPIQGVTFSPSGISDMDGEFEIINSHFYRLKAVPKGFVMPLGSYFPIIYPKDKNEIVKLADLILKKASPISGQVVDENGNPVAKAEVRALWTFRDGSFSSDRGETVTTNDEGKFNFERTQEGVDTGLEVQSLEMSSLEAHVVTSFDPRTNVTLKIAKEGLFELTGIVRDRDGKPIEKAKIVVNRKLLPPGRKSSFGSGNIAPKSVCETDDSGRFKFPLKLQRCSSYHVNIEAIGFVGESIAAITNPEKGNLELATIVLKESRGVRGIVADSTGKPISGVRVWSHGVTSTSRFSQESAKPVGAEMVTGEDGTFALTGLHTEAQFIFAAKDGFLQSGWALTTNQATLELKLRNKDEKIPAAPVSFESPVGSVEDLKTLLNRLIKFVGTKGTTSRYSTSAKFSALMRSDRAAAESYTNSMPSNAFKAPMLAALGHHDDALEICLSLKTADERASALQSCAKATEDKANKILLLTESGFELSNIADLSSRIVSASFVVDQLLDLGEKDLAMKITNVALPAALAINMEGRNEFAKAWFAKAVVRLDYESAWKLIEGSRDSKNQTSGRFARHCGSMAHKLADSDPEKAESLLNEIGGRGAAEYAQRVAYRMAQVDAKRAIGIVDRIQNWDSESYVNGLGALATAFAPSDPAQAKELLRTAVNAFKPERQQGHSFGNALNMLDYCESVDAKMFEEAFWKAIDVYANPNVSSYSPDRLLQERVRQKSELLFLLVMTDRFPVVQEPLVDSIFETIDAVDWKDPNWGSWMDDLAVSFAAMTLHDPGRTVEWYEGFYDKVPEKYRRHIPMPWVVMANSLSMNRRELSRYLANEVMHKWVPGAED